VGATFIITLREAFEASLILGIVYTYLDRIGARDYRRYVTWGGLLGLVASVAMGLAVTLLSGPLVDLGPDVVGAAIIFLAVGLLSWHSWWMREHARAMAGEVQRRIDAARANQRLWLVGLIAFTGVFREGAETVLFLWGLMAEATEGVGWSGVAAGVAGIGAAAALGWLVFRGGRWLSLPHFFGATTVLILLLAAGLLSTGVGKLQGLGVLPMGAALWDTSWLLSDRSGIGSFLSGLVGYRARPSGAEVAAYAIYVLAMGTLLFAPRPRAAVKSRP
jgi:high-affinity iron transporter